MNLEPDECKKVLFALESRTKKSKIATYSIILLSLFMVVSFFSSFLYYHNQEKKSGSLQDLITIIEKTNSAIKSLSDLNQEITDNKSGVKRSDITPTVSNKPAESTIKEAIAVAAPYLIFFTAIMFIGYTLRLLIIFIKYNMQMTNDYENQTISFLLSKGSTSEFKDLIQTLRSHNINFEKTPNLPQEKLIYELIDLARSNKNKN
ncbi:MULTISPECIES: hypothetical protein [Enterobacter]|uniref:hypothetical protein n=1 Tax=Enterobacter TaxID=547 RepID=UPI0018723F5D|nr:MULTISPECIES: hypothetical protein [Enterobacter]MBE4810300.1 hypothetical protein [Enterobacter cloacae complex sp. P44RS]MBE4830749.1 hypothetical protein [Enterobacter cloacae complex sp. P42RS]MBE4836022.1 hypothetical protein [Enterobacter cloacae complex sp. P46RS]MBE4840077.1 hypothetical protein [Enterobacter cloacae complex sp. P42C]MCK6738878.1 hypothetical protein [Enterobacter bugandensis]